MKKASNLLTGLGLSILGLALLGGGGYFFKQRMAFYSQSVAIDGVIVEVESSKSKKHTYYRPIITFDAKDGKTYLFTAETSSSSMFDFIQGDQIKIRYIAENPSEAKIDSFLDLWSLPVALLISGVVIVLSGTVSVYRSNRRPTG